MQKFLKTFLCLYMLGTIGLLAFNKFSNHRPPRYVPESYRLDQEIIERLNTKWNLQLFGIGGGGIEGLELMTYVFNAYDCRPKTVEEARSLIVECAEIALDLVNRDETIRPYLPISRMQGENLNLTLIFCDRDGAALQEGDFDCLHLYKGNILYIVLPKDKLIHREPYSKALKLVQAQKSGLTKDPALHAKTP